MPDCYKCEYRGTIPGDAHSRCNHPMDMFTGKADEAIKKLNIVGDLRGIKRGWFMWPANYDPVWLKNCDGFKAK